MPPAASKWDKVKPAGIKTWVRIRPLAAEGEKGHADGEAVEKQLGEFDEKVVNIINHDQKGKVSPYDYMSKVFPVKCTQEDVGQEVLGDGGRLLEDFWNERSVMIFAYGQTGTGKTTTMFGFPESLASEVPDPGWGLLPRAVHATLEHNAQLAKQGVHTVLLLSAVEFYAFMAYDLADKAGKQMCTMKGHQVIGNTYTKCDSPAILKEFIERVYSNRKVVSTKMNDGSSRSHCAMILTLLTLDASTRTFRQTQFSIVDLAGAERPEKALGFRITKEQAVLEMFKYMRNPTEDMTPGLQGYLINFELSNLLTEVVGATNCHKAGRKYTPGWGMSGQGAMSGFRALESPPRVPLGCLPPSASLAALAGRSFFGGALAGETRLGALICLSQSPSNGWETWYSITNYGKQLSELRTCVKPVEALKMDAVLKEAQKAAKEAVAALESSGTSASAMKYAPYKLGVKVFTEQRLTFLKVLNDMAGKGGGGGSSAEPAPAARPTPTAAFAELEQMRSKAEGESVSEE